MSLLKNVELAVLLRLVSGQPKHLSLWVGTRSGHVFVYQVTVPDGEKRREEDVTCFLGKYWTPVCVRLQLIIV